MNDKRPPLVDPRFAPWQPGVDLQALLQALRGRAEALRVKLEDLGRRTTTYMQSGETAEEFLPDVIRPFLEALEEINGINLDSLTFIETLQQPPPTVNVCAEVCPCCNTTCSGKHLNDLHGVDPDDHWALPQGSARATRPMRNGMVRRRADGSEFFIAFCDTCKREHQIDYATATAEEKKARIDCGMYSLGHPILPCAQHKPLRLEVKSLPPWPAR